SVFDRVKCLWDQSMGELQDWVGKTEERRDVCDAGRVQRLAATLDYSASPWRPGVLPPLGHWLCFLPHERQSLLGEDGHPRRAETGILPNSPLPRRMWAGSRIRFKADIPLDTPLVRTSTLISATPKQGRTGAMLFLTVRHVIAEEGGEAAIVEEQDIVCREAHRGPVSERTAEPAGAPDPVVRTIAPDPVLLLRYSALTFNAHRIHYDRDYARSIEGYAGLVVHGPLIATLLLDHLLRGDPYAQVKAFQFRAASPVFAGEQMSLGIDRDGNAAALRAISPAGIAMHARAELAP
ncbi:MAG TPA: MaoC family dehydratase N-terminal domain-containing protein, partial [Sphingomonas sp.]|nr:MaoC family dehydratase N-terminal domain-containing protein [Sphingomonas sp.]